MGRYNNLPGFFEIKNEASFAYRFDWLPLESMDFIQSSKCFTHFNEKQFPKGNYKINIDHIIKQILFSYYWFPCNEKFGISIALHSPNIVPPRDSFYKTKQNTLRNIYFSKVEEKRLLHYDNCRVYNMSNYDFETRSDCLDKCFLNSVEPKCHELVTIKRPYTLFKNQLSNNTNRIDTIRCQDSTSYTHCNC